jgi:hypothetical protein
MVPVNPGMPHSQYYSESELYSSIWFEVLDFSFPFPFDGPPFHFSESETGLTRPNPVHTTLSIHTTVCASMYSLIASTPKSPTPDSLQGILGMRIQAQCRNTNSLVVWLCISKRIKETVSLVSVSVPKYETTFLSMDMSTSHCHIP